MNKNENWKKLLNDADRIEEQDEYYFFFKMNNDENEEFLKKIRIDEFPIEFKDRVKDLLEQNKNQGISNENRKLFIQASDYKLNGLFYEYKDEEEGLILKPEWQREYVWTNYNKSRLIESFLLDIPVPPVFFAQRKDNKLEVVDGQQRLRTIFDFFENKIALKNLKVKTKLNEKRFNDLDDETKRKFKNAILRTIVILKDSSRDIKFELFSRINSGSLKLSKQEIRNAMFYNKYSSKKLKETYNNLIEKKIIKSRSREKSKENIVRLLAIVAFAKNYLQFNSKRDELINSWYELNDKQIDTTIKTFENFISYLKNNDKKIDKISYDNKLKILLLECLIYNYSKDSNIEWKKIDESYLDENKKWYIEKSIITWKAFETIANFLKEK